MKRIKHTLIIGAITVILCFITACTKKSTMAYTFNVDTGDKLKVTLDTTDGYKIKQKDGTFSIESKEGKLLTQGYFQLPDTVEQYFNNLDGADGVTILKKETVGNTEYIFYYYDNNNKPAWNCIIKITGSKAGIGLTNSVSEESAKEVMKRLTYEVQ